MILEFFEFYVKISRDIFLISLIGFKKQLENYLRKNISALGLNDSKCLGRRLLCSIYSSKM